MVLDAIVNNWNDALTLVTAAATLLIGYHQVQYYRNQAASFGIEAVTDTEYHDFEKYTRYEFTVKLRNDGRDSVSIPDAGLEINGETIDASTHQVDGRAILPAHEFRTIRLGGNDYDTVELHGIGDAVSTRDELTGVFWMESSSDGRVETDIKFERAP